MDIHTQPQKVDLYTFYLSSASWRVRIVLNYKAIPHNYKFIHLFKGEHKSEQYNKINPINSVPSLVLPNGQVLVESMAICEYIEEVYKDNPLFPKDPVRRAQVRGFCQVINSGMQPYQNLSFITKVSADFQTDKMIFAKHWVLRGMETLQKLLQKTKGKYCFGDQVTLADAFFFPQVQGGINRFGVEIDKYPNSKAVLDNLREIEAFRLAEPQNQPDFEK